MKLRVPAVSASLQLLAVAGAIASCTNGTQADGVITPMEETRAESLIVNPPVVGGYMEVASAYSLVWNGSAFVPGTPEVGDRQGIAVIWKVDLTPPPGPFIIRLHVPGHDYDSPTITLTPGVTQQETDFELTTPTDASRPIALDGPIPFTVTIDPNGTSGAISPAPVYSGTYTPTPPATALEAYGTRNWIGGEHTDMVFTAPAGVPWNVVMADPINTSHQTVTTHWDATWSVTDALGYSASGLLSTQSASGSPPYYWADVTDTLPANRPDPFLRVETEVVVDRQASVSLSRIRVNKDILSQVTWDALDAAVAARPQLAPDLVSDSLNDISDPSIASFVDSIIGASYRTTLSPYAAARKLHVAVSGAITYTLPSPAQTAVQALATGKGDCGAYSMLLTTVLRSIGIPARIIFGNWPTGGGTHALVEFWMPGAGWIPADATVSSVLYPHSNHAYYFGIAPHMDMYFVTEFGTHYQGPNGRDFAWLQAPMVLDSSNAQPSYSTFSESRTLDPSP